MKGVFNLEEFVDHVDEVADVGILLHTGGPLPIPIVKNLRRLRRLGLLKDDVLLALVGRAPVDPLGVYGAMKAMGVWAFQASDCTMLQILAKKAGRPVALMRLDLLSDDLDFVILRNGELVPRERVSADTIVAKTKERGMTGDRLHAWIVEKMKAAIDEGMANAG